ncbi:uncharacterized protein LOC133783138 [Humulus lupulus]|uniref:uncharacterized protein LOC133783138 n=1 Tax=Humulus lupulus TaxID=3486 RepID=UPI002B4075CC|nr:uncharacterized protein LOC133783138 [Humulus lupulus]
MEDNIFKFNIDLDHLHPQDLDEEVEEETEEADEALSLSELPLSSNQNDQNYGQESFKNTTLSRRSSSEPPEFFEFFSDVSSGENMCSAEDIIFCGRLIPFKEQYSDNHSDKMSLKNVISFPEDFIKKQTGLRRRSESLSELQSSSVSRSSSTKAMAMRNSRSLDYQKLRRSSNYSMVSPGPPDIDRNSSVKSSGKSDSPPKKPFRPRWSSFLMFGMARFPTEMDLSDIKSRQVRRSPSTLFPTLDSGGGNFPVSRNSSSGKASWKLLKALSCKDHASVAVTASLCVSHV